MKKILVYIKDYKKEVILSPLFKLLEATLELFVPLIMASIIDTGVAAGDRQFVLHRCLLMMLLSAIGLAFSLTAQYFAARAAVGFASRLRHVLFSHIGQFSYSQLDRLGSSTMITRMTSDINQVQTGVNLFLRLLLRTPFIVFGAMIMALTIDVRSALIFLAVIPILAAVVFAVMLTTIPLYRRVQGLLDSVTGKTRENLTGVRVIRAFRQEEREIEEFDRRNDALSSAQIFVGRISAMMNPTTYAIVNIAIASLIWVGAVRVNSGALRQGQVVALYNYMSMILVELIKLANLIITVTRSIACGNRIGDVLDIPAENLRLSDGERIAGIPGSFAVEMRDARFRYDGAAGDALSGISFKANRGDVIGIIGATGSGKTTLVNLIAGFYGATQGSVLINGVDIGEYPLSQLRDMIGVVPQKAALFAGTLRENMLWGDPDASDNRIWMALETAQARDIAESRPELLDMEISQGGGNLSGGQRQRLTIARALLRDPEILILDDSASALDLATDARLRAAISGIKPRPTTFIVSQRAASVMHADRIIVLEGGEAVGVGRHDELLAFCGVYREIYDSQFTED